MRGCFRVTTYEENARIPEAIDTWKRLAEVEPKYSLPYNRIAMIFVDSDKSQEALDIVNRGLQEIPDSVDLLGRRAFIYLEDFREYKKAMDDLMAACDRFDQQETWWEKGQLYFEAAMIYWSQLNDAENALKYYQLAHDYGYEGWSKSYIADYYSHYKGDYEKAISIYSECIEADSGDTYVYYARGWAYKQAGDVVSADRDFDMVIATAPSSSDHHDIHRFAGLAYLEKGLHRKAKRHFRQAEKLVKTEGTPYGICFCIYQSWARYHMYFGEYGKALEQIELALGIANSVRNNAIKQEILSKSP